MTREMLEVTPFPGIRTHLRECGALRDGTMLCPPDAEIDRSAPSGAGTEGCCERRVLLTAGAAGGSGRLREDRCLVGHTTTE